MKTFRVLLSGEQDNVVYSVKEFEAQDAAAAAHIARDVCELIWGGQRLKMRVAVSQGAAPPPGRCDSAHES